jgi:hypothetical protein
MPAYLTEKPMNAPPAEPVVSGSLQKGGQRLKGRNRTAQGYQQRMLERQSLIKSRRHSQNG